MMTHLGREERHSGRGKVRGPVSSEAGAGRWSGKQADISLNEEWRAIKMFTRAHYSAAEAPSPGTT